LWAWFAAVSVVPKTRKRSSLRGKSHDFVSTQELLGKVQLADREVADIDIWKEALFGAELVLLFTSPIYYGLGIPSGDGSAVVLIPGFLNSDHYLAQMNAWLERMGYRPYASGIGINAECPNLLIQHRISDTIDRARSETGRKVHLLGHSLGGVIARSVAGQRPKDVASVITLASPFRGTIAHRSVLQVIERVRQRILQEHGSDVLPHCYTARCTCNYLTSLRRKVPSSILQTAIYTMDDGVVDWRCCRTGDPARDFCVPGTHIGLAFNVSAYGIIANRLAEAASRME